MPSNDFIIRDYQTTDYQDLMQLWDVTDMNTPGRGDNEQTIEHTISIGGKLLIMFNTKENCIIGSSWLTTDGRRLYLHHFAISPEYQGRGYSKPLLRKSLDFAKKIGQQIKLEVHENNILARNLYKRSGFKYLGDYDVFIIRDVKLL